VAIGEVDYGGWHQDAELLLVPKVHPGLVADLNRRRQASEDLAASLDDRILRVLGQVGIVEVGQVVVENARLGQLAGDHVPDSKDMGQGLRQSRCARRALS
jgi:hypothetical protein